jgi:hypothetical protein
MATERRRLLRLGALFPFIATLLGVILNIPGPATAPGVAPHGIQVAVLIAVLLSTVPTTIGSTFLVWRGLGGD